MQFGNCLSAHPIKHSWKGATNITMVTLTKICFEHIFCQIGSLNFQMDCIIAYIYVVKNLRQNTEKIMKLTFKCQCIDYEQKTKITDAKVPQILRLCLIMSSKLCLIWACHSSTHVHGWPWRAVHWVFWLYSTSSRAASLQPIRSFDIPGHEHLDWTFWSPCLQPWYSIPWNRVSDNHLLNYQRHLLAKTLPRVQVACAKINKNLVISSWNCSLNSQHQPGNKNFEEDCNITTCELISYTPSRVNLVWGHLVATDCETYCTFINCHPNWKTKKLAT